MAYGAGERQSTAEPDESYERFSVQAEIENVLLTATRSIPTKYGLSVTTILSGGCSEPGGTEVMRESGPDGDVLTVLIFNLMPAPKAEVECTAQIRYSRESFSIGELPEGDVLTIHINDQTYTLRGGDFDVIPVNGWRPDDGDSSADSDQGQSGSDEAMSEPDGRGYDTVTVEAGIESITVSAAKSLPPQYRLHITSVLNGGCAELTPVSTRRDGEGGRRTRMALLYGQPTPAGS